MSTEQRLKEKYEELNYLLNQDGDLPEEKLSNYAHQIGQKVGLNSGIASLVKKTNLSFNISSPCSLCLYVCLSRPLALSLSRSISLSLPRRRRHAEHPAPVHLVNGQ